MPTNTKTSTTTLAERAEASRANLRDARAALAAAESAQQRAAFAEDGFLSRRRSGDLTVTALDLATARAGIDLAAADRDYAASQVKRAERALVNDETHLAHAVAAGLTKVLDGFEVTLTTEAHTSPETVNAPVVYLEQPEASKVDPISGRISGLVDLFMVRPGWGRALEDDDLIKALTEDKTHADVQPLGSRNIGEVVEDRFRISVRSTWPRQVLPTIRKVNGESLFSQFLANAYAQQMQRGTRFVQRSTERSGRGYAVDAAGEHTTVSETVDTQGVRTAVLRSTIIAGSHDPGMTHNTIVTGLEDFINGQVDTYAAGLGKIQSIRFKALDPEHATVRGRRASGRIRHAVEVETAFSSLTAQ